jgi:alpha-L-rhamnosidase
LKRRIFIKNSLAASVSVFMPGVVFMSDSSSVQDVNAERGFLNAQMIWCAESVPVPLLTNGSASRIASSSEGHPTVQVSDLHTVFVRELILDEGPSYASIRLFCYTRYRLYINGVYCGRGPSRFQNQRPEYDTREISAALRKGRNVIAVLVHRDAPTGRIMRHDPGFAAVVHIGNGLTAKTIATDPHWLSRADLSFNSRDEAWSSIEEHIDARKGFDLTDPRFSCAGWPSSIPVAGPEFLAVWPRTTPLQRETVREWSGEAPKFPLALNHLQGLTLDLPEIMQAYHELELEADEGSEIEVAYLLPDGERSGRNTYVSRGGTQCYVGGDTFAFNQLSIRLISGRCTLTHAKAVEVRYPFDRAGAFECSDPFLSQLWKLCARSLEVLSEDSYVDCADRERVEWTDDSPPAFDCTRVMMRGPDSDGRQYWGDNRLLKSLLRRIGSTQQPDGQIKAHSCSERWDIHAIMEDRSLDWVVLLREYFDSSGDTELIKELWPTLDRLMNWFLDHRTNRGLVLAREWEVWDNPLRYQVCEGAGLNALFYRALCDASYLGKQIGELSRSEALSGSAERLQSNFNALLWNPKEGTYDGALFGLGSKTSEQLNGRMFPGPIVDGRYQPTVQAALFALYSGIVPAEKENTVRNWILAHLDQVEGPMSHYYLFHALYRMQTEAQDQEVVARIKTGWKDQVASPWQTAWEDLSHTGGSKVHMYGIVPGYFLTAFILGARRMGPVTDRTILIEPRCGNLTSAEGIAVTEFGPVKMKWSKASDDGISIECDLPPKTKTTLRLYRFGKNERIVIDQQPHQAVVRGSFLEVPLLPGSHMIQYTGSRTS